MNLADVEANDMYRGDMREEAEKIAEESQEIMDLIAESDRDDLEKVYTEMHEIHDKAAQILEKLGE